MSFSRRSRIGMRGLLIFLTFVAIMMGAFIGLSSAMSVNIGTFEEFNASSAALPTQIFDIKGRKITEFFSDEKRDLVHINELPPHLIYALLTREDQDFFNHPGFSIKGFARGMLGIITGRNLGGGSTITQQLAGNLFADRSDRSLFRKIKELWYSIQLEHQWTKQQILEEYMNKMFFGHGAYGVEAASQFYFGHSAREISVAESAILVIQLAGTTIYSPLRNAERARKMQREILNQMVNLKFVTAVEADQSFDQYWLEYDYSRSPDTNVFFSRSDLAPYFSEYVRTELTNNLLLGSSDIYRDGYKVYTTLNLDFQREAQSIMADGIDNANRTFKANTSGKSDKGSNSMVPVVDMLSLMFDVGSYRVADTKQINDAKNFYRHNLNPVVDSIGLIFGTPDAAELVNFAKASRDESKNVTKRNTVEGALITLDNSTGYIMAVVGGRKFEQANQLNRAIQGRLQPGSSFKPLYYAGGIERGDITAATRFYDSAVEFTNDDGSLYTPLNYNGVWEGPVLTRHALIHSMNIPSIRLLSKLGFDDAIATSSRLLHLSTEELPARNFGRQYPLGLGVVSVSPLEMARAYATFPRLGKSLEEVGIRYIQDRTGKVIAEPEKDLRTQISSTGGYAQLLSPQTSYIMVDMLMSTVKEGTLMNPTSAGKMFTMPMAGKTGTTQNWADAWTVGFSPYYTTAVWLGFDTGGSQNSLGTNQTGSKTAGPIWAKFMKYIHEGLKPQGFSEPGGLVRVKVTANGGLLPPDDYTGPTIVEIFKVGTEPTEIDEEASKTPRPLPDLPKNTRFDNLDTKLDTGDLDLDAILNQGKSPPPSGNYNETLQN